MAVSEQLKSLVEQLPAADARGMYCTDIDKDKIDKTIAEIARGGKENIVGLIDMLAEPGSEADVKPHYALHGVANHALVTKNEVARREFSETLAGQLSSQRSAYIRGYLCQELQWAGRGEAVAALARLLNDAELVDPAAMALVAIKEGAAEVLRGALPAAKDRCRLVIIHALAALGDAAAADIFRVALKDTDRDVRVVAGAGLAKIGDAAAADLLLAAADGSTGWERIQATKQCIVLAEKLAAGGQKPAAKKIYTRLRDTRTDPAEKYIREAADKALAAV